MVWAAALWLTWPGGGAGAAIPGADDPKVYTYHRFREQRLDFHRRTLVEAYKTVGKRDAKWDDAAVKALDALARYFANGAVELIYKADPPPHDEVLKLADAAIAAGCDDPMVLYARGAMLHDTQRMEEARPVLEKSLELAKAGNYPPFRVTSIASRLSKFYDPRQKPADGPKFSELKNVALTFAERSVKVGVVGKDHRHVLSVIVDEFDEAPLTIRQKFVAKIEADAQTDPWMLHLLKGKLHIRQGWAVRGGGFANTVTDRGWKGFFDELAQAREHLSKAHELHPEYPEAATQMIEVAMGAGRAAGDTREWFDKAAKAQFDYFPAYHKYVWSIYPRWHGDHEQMFAFGLECLQTERYDTYVPYQLMKTCEKIDKDGGTEFAVYRIPEVYKAVTTLFENIERKFPEHVNKAWYRAYHVGIAWRGGQYRDAAALLDRVGDKLDPAAFELVRAWPPLVLSEVRAMTSKHAGKLREARALFADGQNYPGAIDQYREVLRLMGKDKDDPGLLFVRYRLKQFELERDFHEGKEVSLTPGEDLAPWYVQAGDWKRDKDGALVGTTKDDGRRARLLCMADFGTAYELSAKVEWPVQPSWLAAVYVGVMGPTTWSHAGVTREGEVFLVSGYESRKFPQEVLPGANQMVVRVNGGQMQVSFNGKPVGQIRIPLSAARDVHVGLGIPTHLPGRVVRFSDVKIKMLGAGTGAPEEN